MTPTTEPTVAPLSSAICEQMIRAFPLGDNARIIKTFTAPEQPDGPYPHAIMGDNNRQVLVMAGRHPYELMSSDARRRAGFALAETEFANVGMTPIGAIFALLNGQVVKDKNILFTRQGECLFGRAFNLVQTTI